MHESGFGRVIGVLISPEKTFRSIAERPTWVVPLLLLMLITGVVGYAVGERIDYDKTVRQKMAESGQSVSEAQIEKGVEFAKKFGAVFTLMPAVLSPIVYLLIALVFMGILRLAGSEIRFDQSFSVNLHSMMPWMIHGLLSLPLILRLEEIDPDEMQRRGVLLSNLAALAPEGSGKVLTAFLASLDLFSVWTLILLIIGYRVAARVSTATAAGVAVTLWLLWVGVKLGFIAAFA